MDQLSAIDHGISEICLLKQESCSIGKQDIKSLLELLPAEVWMQIFRSPRIKNLNNILESSIFFNQMLHPFKTQIWFGPVLKFVVKYLPHYYTTGKILQTCRRVCHMWKKGVDLIVQDKSLHCNIETEKSQALPKMPRYMDYYMEYPYQFQSLRNVTRFENHFQRTHLNKNMNPFVARYVEVRYSVHGWKPDFFTKLEQVFKKCGHHIFYLHLFIQFPVAHPSLTEFHGLLRLVPNLKVLTIYTDWNMYTNENLDVPPFPVLSSVECIKVYGNLPITEKVFEYVVQSNPHVKSVSRRTRVTKDEDLLYALPMPNLEQMRIGFSNIVDIRGLSESSVNWPLRKFVADLTFNNTDQTQENVNICFDVFGQKFGNTLKELYIFFLCC